MREPSPACRSARDGLPVGDERPDPPGSCRAGGPRARRFALLLCTLLAGALSGGLHAQQRPQAGVQAGVQDLLYTVQPGDTLIGIAGRLLEPANRWRDLQRLNGVGVPARLETGAVLRIRPDWIRSDPSPFVIREVGGIASIDGAPARTGAVGREGSRIDTGADGVVVMTLGDGTTLTIPPASTVRIDRLRQYLGPDAIEARFGVERGAIDTRSAPARRRALEIRTPSVTAAVRGTEFRFRARERDAAIEVLNGAVGAASDGGRAEVGAGEGVIASADAPPRIERLLAAPALDTLPGRTEAVSASLPFEPVAGAAGYRVQVARDAGFTRLLSDRAGAAPEVAIASREDGPLFVRVRAVSAIGLEGRAAERVVEVAARPEPPLPLRPPERAVVFDAAVEFSWAQPEGVSAYRLQVAADPAFTSPIHDSVAPEAARRVELPALTGGPATWWWRIASVVGAGATARQGPFSAPRAVEQRPVGGAPAGSVDDSRMDLSWPALPGHRYQFQLATDAAFATVLLERTLDAPQISIDDLAPGVYHTRVRSIDPQGIESPYGPVQRFEIKFLLRSGAGAPVGSGGGTPVELLAPR